MAENIHLEIVTPEKTVVSEPVQIVACPGNLGEFGVLVGHSPFLSTLKTGIIRYTDLQGQEHYVFVSGGFAEALPDRVTVLAESAERRRDIDVDRAKAAMERARKRLADERTQEQIDADRARAALQRSMTRLKVVETRQE